MKGADRAFLVAMAVATIVAYGSAYGVAAGAVLSVVAALSCPLLAFLLVRWIMTTAEQQATRSGPGEGTSGAG